MTFPPSKPLVAIVGRPNVGKSTLFNRLIGMNLSIVSDVAGTTRDRVTAETVWADHPFIVVDTGGLDDFPQTEMWSKIKGQIDLAIDQADVIVMLADAEAGATAADRDIADVLRRTGKPIVLAANKSDNDKRAAQSVEFYELGLGDPVAISAYHNYGMDDLMERVVALFPETPAILEVPADVRVAIVGRTNVGKSALSNAISGQERSVVSSVAGTTRDALDTLIMHDDRRVLLIDTAGLRKRGSIEQGIEQYSALRTVRAIDRAEVAVLVMDASELATAQDTHVAGYVLDSHKAIVLAINKWDLAKDLELTKEDATAKVRERFKFLAYAPIVFVSAERREGIKDLLYTAVRVSIEWNKGVPRYGLRRTVLMAVAKHPPQLHGRQQLKVYGITQDRTGPPSFTFYVNKSDLVHFSYERYLEKAIREEYGFEGSPLRIRFKGRGEQ
ncbi:MAG: ribosome biogenesis GTPase Der [SAR202 cluster bacterium]|nr:ribosome biogenesis GTPase Der [SAR202 cluster bacterium]